MVDRYARHRRIDRAIVERERLCAGGDRGRGAGGALGAHRRAGLHCQHPAIGWLIGAGAGAHVEHRARFAERRVDARGDARIGTAVQGVGASVALVVGPRGHREPYPTV